MWEEGVGVEREERGGGLGGGWERDELVEGMERDEREREKREGEGEEGG